jgi:transposase
MYPKKKGKKREPDFKVEDRRGGRPLKKRKRQKENAIFYEAKTGSQRRFLPKDDPS